MGVFCPSCLFLSFPVASCPFLSIPGHHSVSLPIHPWSPVCVPSYPSLVTSLCPFLSIPGHQSVSLPIHPWSPVYVPSYPSLVTCQNILNNPMGPIRLSGVDPC